MLALSYRPEERVETAIELALEVPRRKWSRRGLVLRPKFLERLLKFRKIDLDDAQRALLIEDAHEQEFLPGRGSSRHEYLPFRASMVQLVERLAVQLAPKLAG